MREIVALGTKWTNEKKQKQQPTNGWLEKQNRAAQRGSKESKRERKKKKKRRKKKQSHKENRADEMDAVE